MDEKGTIKNFQKERFFSNVKESKVLQKSIENEVCNLKISITK